MRETNFLRRLNPLTKLALAVAYIVTASLVFDPSFQLSIIAATLIPLIIIERIGPLELTKVMWPFALIGFGYLWVNLAFFDRASMYTRATAAVPLVADPAVVAGLTLFLRAIAFGAISFFFVRTTNPVDLARSLMLRARLPPWIGFSLLSALQFLPGLRDDLRLLRLARALRTGGSPDGWRQIFSSYSRLAIPLLAVTIRKAGRAAIAMEARGLRHPMVRTSLRGSPLRPADGFFLGAVLLLLILLVIFGRSGGFDLLRFSASSELGL
jgi:energy-coupling factor transport system permease protein